MKVIHYLIICLAIFNMISGCASQTGKISGTTIVDGREYKFEYEEKKKGVFLNSNNAYRFSRAYSNRQLTDAGVNDRNARTDLIKSYTKDPDKYDGSTVVELTNPDSNSGSSTEKRKSSRTTKNKYLRKN